VETTELLERMMRAAERQASAMEDMGRLMRLAEQVSNTEFGLLCGHIQDLRLEVKDLGARLERVLEASHD
jgi:hypothetical protein